MASRVASPEFVGREAELAALGAALERAQEGTPAVALIGGESGVGKSRLVAEAGERARAAGARVLVGDCVDLGDAELAYAPIVGALRALEREALEAAAGAAVAGLRPLLPQFEGDEVIAAPGALAQGRLFETLLTLLGGLAQPRPLVLVIEDVHWADRSTRDFLAFLIRNARRQRILVVGTYRTDELHRRHPLRPFLAEADRAPSVTRLALQRFTREELVAQLAGILEHRPDPRLVDELFRRAEGNPFFTEELVAAGSGAGQRLTDDVRDALMLRIEALGPEAQAVLRVAAAAGARVRHELLLRASGLPDHALVAGLREAIAHHVLVHDQETDAYAFRHALLREALTDDLLPGERGPLHRALAAALSADPALSASARGAAAELAFHWTAAHDLPAAFAASAQAGAEAERVAAFAEANGHFERAAELWDAVPEERRAAGPSQLELLRRAAEAAHLAGDYDRAVALGRRALALVDRTADPISAALVGERIARYLWVSGLASEALGTIHDAVALLPTSGHELERARVLGAEGHLLMLLGRAVEATPRCEEALALARAADARREVGSILTSLGPAVSMQGDHERAIGLLSEARVIAEELGDLEEIVRAYINLGETLDRAGRLPEAAEVAREGAQFALRSGFVAGLLVAEYATRLIRLGRWDEAQASLDDVLSGPLTGFAGSSALTIAGQLDGLRGAFASARSRLDEAEHLQRQAIGSMWTGPLSGARAEAALWEHRPDEARAVIAAEEQRRDGGDDDVFYTIPVLVLGVRAEADLAVRARATGDAAAEAEAARRAWVMAEESTRLLGPRPDAQPEETRLQHETGLAEAARARGDGDAQGWARLAARWDAFGLPYPAAYARWREAEEVLARGGSRAGAQEALAAAYAIARRLGAGPLSDEVEALARRARLALADEVPTAAPAAAGADASVAEQVGLTARELDVLRLVAAGETNRQIGESLYISQKTVSVHVSRILAKLDARTRVEAAGLAHRLGLLSDDPAATG